MVVSYLMPLWFKIFLKAHIYQGEYRDKLLKLADKHGVRLKNIYVIPSKRSNACAIGFANNKVVCINSNVIEKHPLSEIEGVLVHELGHNINKDILIYTFGIALILIFSAVVTDFFNRFFSNKLLGIFICSIVLSGILYPLVLAFSRWREGLADLYTKRTGNPLMLVRFFNRMLTFEDNDIKRINSNPTKMQRIFFNHPWLVKRVKFLEAN